MDSDGAAAEFVEHLAGLVRFPTITYEDPALIDWSPFVQAHQYLVASYPLVHGNLIREIVASHSLLFTWEGSDPDLPPIVLMAHLDVVPVEPGTEQEWDHEPFSGTIADGFIWGRGSLDDKACLVGILEAVESLLSEGFRPQRTVYLAFGHDEEIGGRGGASAIAGLLAERGVRAEFVLDEGGIVVSGFIPGVEPPLALVGISEKGYLNLEIKATEEGGHSAAPPPHTAVGLVAGAVARMEAHPLPAAMGSQRSLFSAVAAAVGGLRGFVLGRPRFFGPLLRRGLSRSPAANALIRTTQAVTFIEGGIAAKPNVLPQRARAVANYRIRPGDTRESVLAHVRKMAGDDVTVTEVETAFSADPSPMADTESRAFGAIEETIAEVFPDAVLAPWVMVGATDSRHYIPIADNVYRFNPFRVGIEDFKRAHGNNERLPVDAASGAVVFFRRLIERCCRPTGSA